MAIPGPLRSREFWIWRPDMGKKRCRKVLRGMLCLFRFRSGGQNDESTSISSPRVFTMSGGRGRRGDYFLRDFSALRPRLVSAREWLLEKRTCNPGETLGPAIQRSLHRGCRTSRPADSDRIWRGGSQAVPHQNDRMRLCIFRLR